MRSTLIYKYGRISKCRKALENTFDNGMNILYNVVEFDERIGCEVGLVSFFINCKHICIKSKHSNQLDRVIHPTKIIYIFFFSFGVR